MYTSGQLAKRCQVSVRTVQYYDQQELLHARRNASNQRRYQEDDLRRLQRILAYRQLGFTIKDIQKLLDQQDDQALRTAIALQEQRTQQELRGPRTGWPGSHTCAPNSPARVISREILPITLRPNTRTSSPVSGSGPWSAGCSSTCSSGAAWPTSSGAAPVLAGSLPAFWHRSS